MNKSFHTRSAASFSLVELLVATAVLTILVLIVFNMTSAASNGLKYSAAKIEAFSSARSAFDIMTRSISKATLNTYYDYYDAGRIRRTTNNAATFVPATYGRYSELEFVCGKNLVAPPTVPAARTQVTHSIFFQTPMSFSQTDTSTGLGSLLNTVGFYIEFFNDIAERPPFTTGAARWRYRLMQLVQPTENFSIYNNIASPSHTWFTAPLAAATPPTRLLASNIIACIICPRLPEDTTPSSLMVNNDYEYDSNIAAPPVTVNWTAGAQPVCMNQLPPTVRVILIALDERSLLQLQGTSTTPPNFGFSYASVFQSILPANQLETDLQTVSDALTLKKLNYRIFQTDVAIRGAKWSP